MTALKNMFQWPKGHPISVEYLERINMIFEESVFSLSPIDYGVQLRASWDWDGGVMNWAADTVEDPDEVESFLESVFWDAASEVAEQLDNEGNVPCAAQIRRHLDVY